MQETTAGYWRKHLGVERSPDKNVFRQVKSPLRIFRPLILGTTYFIIDKLCDYRVVGLQNLKIKPPFILASNHQSNLDYAFLIRKIPPETRSNLYSIATTWLLGNAVTQFVVKAGANCIFVDTKANFMEALRVASDVLRLGKSVFIAPEGDRSYDGSIGEFKVGVGVLAVENNVPIIPAKIDGTFRVLPRGKFFPRVGKKVTVSFGEPLYPDKFLAGKKEENAYYNYKAVTDELKKRVVSL
ncbi:MAG: 1-acyl-sn-glycerol-3-phosphate acyltransferase [Candidatus Margulisbacteria bacterium]|nr:1-acyl-sn-glycerol-3-phosphate acyltransferase [Candidatus Margulisiibacteriota bacterium]MBU1021695.1 1-acyl-sn-glycerol-3-phosphate acyltransferase [Candidatus Margulisiibacteriota bacterium]MBU1729573.1 1-acyl-sn-glycerol-3-phosphate acyltransferase [Candidatus Margulisiibacteriota bacterium]MBU1955059.1 1-acyl-sn-glycerol-3-phosphate acyltransferase [Candidatus Margulisiibacteriota bacterium]